MAVGSSYVSKADEIGELADRPTSSDTVYCVIFAPLMVKSQVIDFIKKQFLLIVAFNWFCSMLIVMSCCELVTTSQ